MVQIKLAQAFNHGSLQITALEFVVPNLGGQEVVIACKAGVFQALTNALFVVIHLGGIEMAIADLGGFGDHFRCFVVVELVRPKAKGRDFSVLPVPVNHTGVPPCFV